jgi:hypothetical protein
MKKQMTEWFPSNIKPARIGVYEIQWWFVNCWDYGFSYWNGKQWANSAGTPESALLHKKWTDGAIQDKKWRGFTEKQA